MNDTIPLAGVIGWPIHHSRSPSLHGFWLQRYGLSGHYIPMPISPEDLESALVSLPKLGFKGINVTLPHKEHVLSLAAEATDTAKAIGAANTLTFLPQGGFEADNTDAYGFIENLKSGAPTWSGAAQTHLVLGAGGAARAVLVALLQERANTILLTNRTRDRAENLAEAFGPRIQVVDWEDASDAVAHADLIVNTTSLGMSGHPPLPLSLDLAREGTLVTDIVYTPLATPLLKDAQHRGLPIVDGVGMLLHQAVPGFARWFGEQPKVDEDLRKAVLG
ncbi:MAG: shikimate dehydrogenase [Pseudomonadota bacterium]